MLGLLHQKVQWFLHLHQYLHLRNLLLKKFLYWLTYWSLEFHQLNPFQDRFLDLNILEFRSYQIMTNFQEWNHVIHGYDDNDLMKFLEEDHQPYLFQMPLLLFFKRYYYSYCSLFQICLYILITKFLWSNLKVLYLAS